MTRLIDGQTWNLQLTDTAGQEEYRGLWAASNLRSDAFLLVYDITNPDTLDALEHFTQLIEMEAEQRYDNGGTAPIRIVAGNKCDLQALRRVKAAEGLEWARTHRCGFMETSAREMVNIEETFALIVRRVAESRRRALGLPAHGAVTIPGVGPKNRMALDPNTEKPIATTIDPRVLGRRKRSFWRRLKCW